MKFPLWASLMALAASAQAAQAAPVPDTMAQRLQACTVCHGKEGRATSEGYFPRIAGKPAGYLFNQLVNFRDGRRHNATMAYLVEHLPDDYLREIAGYFAGQNLPYAAPPVPTAPPQQLALGAALVREGDARRGIPACTACHGERMTGVVPAVPGLIGLSRDYVTGQLGAWQTGQRRAAEPDCMSTIARRLTAQDVSAVAAWLSAQPAPVDAKPAQQPVHLPLPIDCGSGLQ
ncbi:c-type cytochrome [Azohydromonas lata]|uniref:c-type cytochrome n=1 Tax=Azohydromonas lata TaxID=45677 RepID=UPI00082AA0BB|nr:c-type cytochrome [Azohydromonas lata]